MDDPWGSPWADEAPQPLPSKVASSTTQRPVTSDGTLPLDEPSSSPWDDDDGFGEWAAVPDSDGVQTPVQDTPEKPIIKEWHASVAGEGAQGKDVNGDKSDSNDDKERSPWFNRDAPIASFTNVGLEIPELPTGKLSPDPWAEETIDAAGKGHDIQGEPLDDNVSLEEAEHTLAQVSAQLQTRSGESLHGNEVDETLRRTLPDDQVQERLVDENVLNGALKAKDLAQGESPTSRPSSSPSDRSHPDEILTESPRTSFEDEVKRPEEGGPSKVKDLVRLFDGIATSGGQDESDDKIQDPKATGDQFETPVAGQSEDEFGDFEEGTSSVDKSPSSDEPIPRIAGSPAEKAKIDDSLTSLDGHAESVADTPTGPVERLGSVKFDPDLTHLDEVFTNEHQGIDIKDADTKDAPVFENIILDSFSSTDQRKTWYRISRYGSLRKHNGGDEDNYIGISWKSSKVKVETLKIVARWIEEDRIGGGVILGGGTKLGSMFGWGQKDAAPISVAAALASKKGKSSRDAVSTQTSGSLSLEGPRSKRNSLEYTSTPRAFQSPKSPTTAQFSWSTGSPTSATMGRMSHELASPASTRGRRPMSGTLPSPAGPLKPPTAEMTSKAQASTYSNKIAFAEIPPPKQRSQAQDPTISATLTVPSETRAKVQIAAEVVSIDIATQEDDDWGEMISSPALESISSAPPISPGQQKLPGHVVATESTLEKLPSPLGISYSLSKTAPVSMSTPTADQSQRNSSSFEIKPQISEFPPPQTTNSDGWSTVDFSFFDAPAAIPPRPIPVPSRVPLQNPAPTPRSLTNASSRSIGIPAPYISTSSSKTTGLSSKPTATPSTLHHPQHLTRTKEQQEDSIVKTIVQNLPDLSYMLRR